MTLSRFDPTCCVVHLVADPIYAVSKNAVSLNCVEVATFNHLCGNASESEPQALGNVSYR